jgi:protein-tyrosine phosphatase
MIAILSNSLFAPFFKFEWRLIIYYVQDLEFVVANKVSHIVNCAGKQMSNLWENMGVVYLTFFWMDQESQVLFDTADKATKQIFEFVEKAQKRSQSVLVHSVRGQSRAASVLAVYLMRKYRWSMMKTLEFLSSRRPDLEIKASFISQLEDYERRLHK